MWDDLSGAVIRASHWFIVITSVEVLYLVIHALTVHAQWVVLLAFLYVCVKAQTNERPWRPLASKPDGVVPNYIE